ncbi:MAG: hypothetical protein R3F39_07425 [Myxococcota bacterium]
MKRSLSLCFAVLCAVSASSSALAVTETQLLAGAKKGESSKALAALIAADRTVFHLDAADVARLMDAGLPNDVIDFMLLTPSLYGAEAAPTAPAAPVPAAPDDFGLGQGGPITVSELVAAVKKKAPDGDVVRAVARRGLEKSLSPADESKLRTAGASDALLRYLKTSGPKAKAAAAEAPPVRWTSRRIRDRAELLLARETGATDAQILAAIEASAPHVTELTDDEAVGLVRAGYSAQIVRAMQAAAGEGQTARAAEPAVGSAPPTVASGPAAAPARAKAKVKAKAKAKAQRFTDGGQVIISSGFTMSNSKPEGGDSVTALTLSPSVGYFVVDGLLLELSLQTTIAKGPDPVSVLFKPGYYMQLGDSGMVAVYGDVLLGLRKVADAKGFAGGFEFGLAIGLGERRGGIIRIGPSFMWAKAVVDGQSAGKGRIITFGTQFGVWF